MAYRRLARRVSGARPHSLARRFPHLRRHPRIVLLAAAGVILLWAGGTVLWWSKDLPNPQNINARRVRESTKIFDRAGTNLLYEIGEVHRTTLSLERIPVYLRDATIAAEDDQFYEHHGLDMKGIIRALVVNLTGGRLQGGSTITQQLIKNSILTPERTLRRKVKEAVLALELEQRFSKDQILEMYLNDIPYGAQAYGVEAAAQTYFGKSAVDLTLAEAAIIAALPKAPTYYSPFGSHVEDLRARQAKILDRMAELNMITPAQASSANADTLVFSTQRESITAPHFVFYVKEQLVEQFGERLVEQGGLRVTTTLNLDYQHIAEAALRDATERLHQRGASNAALVALHPVTGDILAMVGSVDYFNEDIDGNVNVTIRHRSPGSAIKPFIYAAAFAKGYTPDTMLVDVETDFGQGYRPQNYDGKEHGPVTMRLGLGNSLNIPSVQTLYLAGIRNATELARRMGMATLTDPDRYGLSLVLGGGEVRLLDMTAAYGALATEGVRYPARSILKIESAADTLLDITHESPTGEAILDPEIAHLVTNILSDNSARALIFGAASPLTLPARPVAAKTGTAQEFRDGWAVGYTPSLVAGVWTGNNDNTPMRDRSDGVHTAGPIWNQFMRQALKDAPTEQFTRPAPLQDIPHAVLRGEMPELTVKWERETDTYFTADCPIAVGIPKTIKELHNVLFYIQRDNPRGPAPPTAEVDPQFSRWEASVAAWRDKHNGETADDPAQPRYLDGLPTPTCGIDSAADLPQVRITEPNTSVLTQSPVTVKAEVTSPKEITEVRFLLDGEVIATRSADQPYQATITFPADFSGRKTLQIFAITADRLIGRANRTFIINPDDSPPTITLHTPPDGARLTPTSFPVVIKLTTSDKSGIATVDVLYQKEGETRTSRAGRTSTPLAIGPNRYDVTWADSPGPGTYTLYAVAYDKTGNTKESARRTVTVE